MTDKVQKIREEVQRLQDLTMDRNKNFYSEAAEGEYNALCNIEHFIDSLQKESVSEEIRIDTIEEVKKIFKKELLRLQKEQKIKFETEPTERRAGSLECINSILSSFEFVDFEEEPVSEKKCIFTKDSYTDEDRKALCEGCKEECEYSKKEELVIEDLEEAAEKYAYEICPSIGVANTETELAFKAGAQWQKEQFEKNRFAACDRQTEEEAEIERDFIMGIIEKEHRQPAFDDAIKYGMRLKEEEIKEALLSEVLPCFMHGGEADEVVAKLDEVLNYKKK